MARAERAVLVDRCADELVADGLLHWEALARDGGFVDLALAFLDGRVDGHLGAWPNEQQVADLDLGGRDLDGLAIAQHDRLRRGQVEERPDGVVGAAAGAHLEPMAEQHERGEHAGCFVEDLALDEERGRDRVQPAHADGDSDQHHHVERLRPECGDGTGEEDRRRVEDDRQAQKQLPHVAVDAERRRNLRAEQLGSDHRPQDDRDREDERNQETVAHVACHRLHRHPGVAAVAVGLLGALRGRVVMSGVPAHRVADVTGHGLARAVHPALVDPAAQLLYRGRVGVERDVRRLRCRVGLDGDDPRPPPERVLDDGLLARAIHAAHVQDGGLSGRRGSAHGVSYSPCIESSDPCIESSEPADDPYHAMRHSRIWAISRSWAETMSSARPRRVAF